MADEPQNPDETGTDDAAAAELFPSGSLDGESITPQQFIKNGAKTEVVASIGKADVPLKSGMIAPDKMGRALVSYSFVKNEEVPRFEGEGAARKIKSWTIRQHLAAIYVEPANDEADLIRSEFSNLMALDGQAAKALLAELRDMATGIRAVA